MVRRSAKLSGPCFSKPDSAPRSSSFLDGHQLNHRYTLQPQEMVKASAHILKQKLRSLLARVPVRKTEFHSEAFAEVAEDLLLCGTALVHHNPQHLRDSVPKKGVPLFPFDELLKNLIIRKADKCLEEKKGFLLNHQ